jgi:TonB family protein
MRNQHHTWSFNQNRVHHLALGFAIISTLCYGLFEYKTYEESPELITENTIRIDPSLELLPMQNMAMPSAPSSNDLPPIVKDEPVQPEPAKPEQNTSNNSNNNNTSGNTDGIYQGVLEEQVEFIGGEDAMYAFLQNNIQYPASAKADKISGVINVSFVVERDGSVSHIAIKGKGDRELEQEAIRVIQLTSGHWKPAKNKQVPMRVICIIPITFNIQ